MNVLDWCQRKYVCVGNLVSLVLGVSVIVNSVGVIVNVYEFIVIVNGCGVIVNGYVLVSL